MASRSNLINNMPYERTPLAMPRWYGPTTSLIRAYNASTVVSSSSAFFTAGVGSIDRIPGTVYTTSAFTSTVWKTVASVTTGSGLISDIIGPKNAGGGATATLEFRITIDGVAYTMPIALPLLNLRGWLGWGLPTDAYHAASQYVFQHDAAATVDFAANINTSSIYYLMGPQDPRVQCLYFASSLLVEMRTIGNSSGGGVNDYAAVVMRRLT